MWEVISSGGPGARAWNQVAYDGRPIISCGATGSGQYMNDFWAWEGSWVRKSAFVADGEPAQREHQGLVSFPDGYTYVFNGHPSGALPWSRKRVIFRSNGNGWEETSGLSLPPGDGNSDSGWPPMRMSAACDYVPPLNGALIAGGANWDPKRTYLLRSDMVIERLDTGGTVPTPSSGVRFNVNNLGKWVPEIGKFALFGGHPTTTGGEPLSDLQLFDPATRRWSGEATPVPGRAEAAMIVRPGKIAIIAGVGSPGFTALKDCWELDIPTWTWSQLPDLPYTMWFQGGWWHEGRYMIAGGFSNSGGTGMTLAYTPTGSVMLETPSSLDAISQ